MNRTLQITRNQTTSRPATPRPYIHKLTQRLQPAVLDQIAADYEAGATTTQLKATYSLGKGTVLRVLADRGVTMRHQPMTNDQVIEAIQLYECGMALKQVGAELGADHETVRKILKRAGVQMRKPWER